MDDKEELSRIKNFLHFTSHMKKRLTFTFLIYKTFSQELYQVIYLWLVEHPSFLVQEQEPSLLAQVSLALLELSKILSNIELGMKIQNNVTYKPVTLKQLNTNKKDHSLPSKNYFFILVFNTSEKINEC